MFPGHPRYVSGVKIEVNTDVNVEDIEVSIEVKEPIYPSKVAIICPLLINSCITVIHILSIYYPYIIHILSIYYPYVIHILSIYNPYIIHMLSIYCPYVIHILSIYYPYYPYVIRILSIYNPYIIHILSIYYPHIIHILSTYYPYIIHILSICHPILPCFHHGHGQDLLPWHHLNLQLPQLNIPWVNGL